MPSPAEGLNFYKKKNNTKVPPDLLPVLTKTENLIQNLIFNFIFLTFFSNPQAQMATTTAHIFILLATKLTARPVKYTNRCPKNKYNHLLVSRYRIVTMMNYLSSKL